MKNSKVIDSVKVVAQNGSIIHLEIPSTMNGKGLEVWTQSNSEAIESFLESTLMDTDEDESETAEQVAPA